MGNFDNIRDSVDVRQYLEKSRSGLYVCPWCGSGNGKNHTGALKYYQNSKKVYCHACGNGGDVVDVYQAIHGGTVADALKALGVDPVRKETSSPIGEKELADYTDSLRAAALNIGNTEYHRGIREETLKRFGVGFVAGWRNPEHPNTPPTDRLIIPTSKNGYLARLAGDGEYNKLHVGKKEIWNLQAIWQEGDPCFVVEGEIDALSIVDVGGKAIGLGGVGMAPKLVKAVKEKAPACLLILALDDDEAGEKCRKELEKGLEGIPFRVVTGLYDGCKDANEALNKDREVFASRVQDAIRMDSPWGSAVDSLLENIKGGVYEPVKTGIPPIDDLMGGGFVRKQLLVIGAAPGMGKTALCQWLMECMANQGMQDFSCMYFCFEMSRDQLIARSLSRWAAESGKTLSPIGILKGERMQDVEEIARWYDAGIAYSVAYNPGGQGDILPSARLSDVIAEMERGAMWQKLQGKSAPFIVVDYLQLLEVEGKEEQDAIKQAMKALKAYAVRWNTCVIAVVANNRESNKAGEASMFSGRGSSSIEYGADCVMSLIHTEQPEEKSLVLVKGRFQKPNANINFKFDGSAMSFTIVTSSFDSTPVGKKKAKEIDAMVDKTAIDNL